MSEYTPTTRWVREWYADSVDHLGGEQEFDRWLAEHDREVAAKALRDAAGDIYLPSEGPAMYVDIAYAERLASLYLKERAERIEKGSK